MSAVAAEPVPMFDMNTTPLIDVMLVLLVMLIITIPPQTHAVKLDLPQNNPNDTPPPIDPVPELHLQPEPNARYELVDQVLAVTKKANVTKMGFVGNEAYMKAF